jgi:hypothetical protein
MTDRVPVSREVFEGIEAVRQSGLTNMLDRGRVVELAEAMGFEASARWVRENRELYARAVFRGFEVRRGDQRASIDTHPESRGPPVNDKNKEGSQHALQDRFLAAILAFPARLDAMETRDEETCRRLAARLAALAEEEFERRTAER